MTDDTAGGLSYRQGLDAVVRLIGGRGTSWIPAVLATLAVQPLRRFQLLEEVNKAEARWGHASHRRPLSNKVLGQTLDTMAASGLIVRSRTQQQFQPHAWCELTPFAHSLLAVLRPVAEWARAHQDELTPEELDDKPA